MGIDGQPACATTSRDKIVVEHLDLEQRWRNNDSEKRYGWFSLWFACYFGCEDS